MMDIKIQQLTIGKRLPPPYKWEYLSITRFLLAFIVLISHLEKFVTLGNLHFISDMGAFEAILGFLLISGFSIGKSIQKDRKNYYWRRVERIYPVYIVSIIITCFVYSQTINISWAVILLVNIIFLNQLVIETSFVGPAWSLALEVWLYILAPLFLRLNYKTLLYLIGISLCCHTFYTIGRSLYDWKFYAGTNYGINLFCLSSTWIVGFGLAIHKERLLLFARTVAIIFIWNVTITSGLQLLYRIKHNEFEVFINTDLLPLVLKAICLCIVYCVVVYNSKLPKVSLLTKNIFNFLGNISYPLYLIHHPVLDELKKNGIRNAPIMIASALIASSLVYFIFDFYSKRRNAKISLNDGNSTGNVSTIHV